MGEDDAPGGRALQVCRQLGLEPDQCALVASLLGLGVSVEAMERAQARGTCRTRSSTWCSTPSAPSHTVSARELEERGGWPVPATLAMISAFGFPAPEPDEPFFSPAEADSLIGAAARQQWWPMEVQLEISRVWGQALARIAAAEVYNFRFETEPRVRGGQLTPSQALATIQRTLAELLPLADPLIVGIHRRWVDYELTQYVVREAEEHVPGAIPGTVEVCLFFCDLKDFTAFAELHGDAAATAAASRFAHVTSDERGEHGRLVKGMGDGAMLVYPGRCAGRRGVAALPRGDGRHGRARAARRHPPRGRRAARGGLLRRRGEPRRTAAGALRQRRAARHARGRRPRRRRALVDRARPQTAARAARRGRDLPAAGRRRP